MFKKVFLFLLVVVWISVCSQEKVTVEKVFLSQGKEILKTAYGKEKKEEFIKRNFDFVQNESGNLYVDRTNPDFIILESNKKGEFYIKERVKDTIYMVLFYLKNEKWTKSTLSINHETPIVILIDGEKKKEEISFDSTKESSVELTLERGLHRVQILFFVEALKRTKFAISLKRIQNLVLPEIELNPEHPLSWGDILRTPFVTDTAISNNGKLCAVCIQHVDFKDDKRYTTLQIRNAEDGKVIFDSAPFKNIKYPTFDNQGKNLIFVVPSSEKGKESLYLVNLDYMEVSKISDGLEGVKSISFSHDSSKIFFIANVVRQKDEKRKYDHLTEMYQRWDNWQDRPHLFMVDLKKKSIYQLTAGESNLFDYSLSADGKKIALLRGVFTKERPYLISEIYLYDIETQNSKLVLKWKKWPDISEILLLKDSKKIAVMASKGEMPGGGLKPKEHSAYNLHLFIVDVESGNYECVTENFRPSLSSQLISVLPPRKNIYYDVKEDSVYFFTTDKDRVRLYKYDCSQKKIDSVNIDDPVMSSPSIALEGKKVLYFSSALGSFWKLKIADIKNCESKVIWFPNEEELKYVKLGLLEPFDVIADDGEIIQGWILYPPNYDKNKKYPTIVAYYGGVMPYGRAFRGEFFWLSGQGYIVYIVTPRGSVGYGQDFADYHCNDWGKRAAQDIIQGVETLIKLRPSVDKDKIGCFGGSYGGFMTLYLIGKSDIFKAAVDYYGISNIASYWGAGWWGFNYGDTAIANSYPWTRKDVFVEQSPLYFADKINTPLLLIHGTKDTNVPIVESDQIFTALRVQNKVVEYIRFFDEDHGINSSPSIRVESEMMMLEWFDKYLKGEGDAWEHRFKDEPKPIEE